MQVDSAILPTADYIEENYLPVEISEDTFETNILIVLDHRGLNLWDKGK